MDSTAGLKIIIDTKDALTANKNLDTLSQTVKKAELRANELKSAYERQSATIAKLKASNDNSEKSINRLANAEAKLASISNRLKLAQDDVTIANKRLDSSISKVENNLQSTNNSLMSFNKLLIAGAVTVATDRLIKYADIYTNLSSRINLTTNDIKEQTKATEELYKIAQTTRQGFAQTADLYSRIALSTEDMNLSQKDMLDLTETINKAMIISGGTAESMNAAIIQLGQAFSADFKAVGQELGSLREQTPALYKAIVDGTGLSNSAFRKAAEEGSLSSEIILKAIKRMSGSVDEDFEKISLTVGQSKQVFENAFVKFVGQLDKTTGASAKLSETITDLANYLGSINMEDFINQVDTYKDIIIALGITYVSFIASLKIAVTTQAIYNGILAITTRSAIASGLAIDKMTLSQKALALATATTTGALKVFSKSNIAIAGLTIGGALLADWLLFDDAVDKTADKIDKLVDKQSKSEIDLKKDQINQLETYIKQAEEKSYPKQVIDQQKKALTKIKKELKDLTKKGGGVDLDPLVKVGGGDTKSKVEDFIKNIKAQISIAQTEDTLKPFKALEEAYKLDLDKWKDSEEAKKLIKQKYEFDLFNLSSDLFEKTNKEYLDGIEKTASEEKKLQEEKLELLSKQNELLIDRNSDNYEVLKAQEEVNLRAEILNLYMGTTEEIEKQKILFESLNKLKDVEDKKPTIKIPTVSEFKKSFMNSSEYKSYLAKMYPEKSSEELEREDKERYSALGNTMGQSFSDVFMQTINGGSFRNAIQQSFSSGGNQLVGQSVNMMATAGATSLAQMSGLSPAMATMGVGLAMGVAGALLEKPQETLISQENYLEKLTASNKAILEETKAFRILNKIFGTDYKADKSSFLTQYKQGYTLNTNIGDGMQNYIESLFSDIENATMKYTIKVGEQTIQKTKSGFLGIGASSSTQVVDIWKQFTGTEVAALQFLSQFGVDAEGKLTSEGLQGVTSAFNSWNDLMTTLDDYSANITDIEKITKELSRIDTQSIKDEMYQMYSNELSAVGINIAELTVDNIGEAFSDTTLGDLIRNNPSLNVEALTGYVNELNSSYLKQIELSKELNDLRKKETLSQMDLAKELKDYEEQLKDLNSTISVNFKGVFDPLLNALKSIKEMASDTVDSMDSQDVERFWELDTQYKKLMSENKFEEAQSVFSKISSLSTSLYGDNDKFKAGITDYMNNIIVPEIEAKDNIIKVEIAGGLGELLGLTSEQIAQLKTISNDGEVSKEELKSITGLSNEQVTNLSDLLAQTGLMSTENTLFDLSTYAREQLKELQKANEGELANLSTSSFKYLDYLGKNEQLGIAGALGKSFADVEEFILRLQSFDVKDSIKDLEEMKSLIGYTFNTETGLISYDQNSVTDLSKLWDVLPQDVKDAYGALNSLAVSEQSGYLIGKESLVNTTLAGNVSKEEQDVIDTQNKISSSASSEASRLTFNTGGEMLSSKYNWVADTIRSYGLDTKDYYIYKKIGNTNMNSVRVDTDKLEKDLKVVFENRLGLSTQTNEYDIALQTYLDELAKLQAYQVSQLPSFAVGASNVPYDMVAQIHKNETIIPATFAESIRQGQMTLSGGSNSMDNGIIRQELRLMNDKLGKVIAIQDRTLTVQRQQLGIISEA